MIKARRRMKVNEVYNKAFKAGFGFNILIFAVLNIISFIIERNEHLRTWNSGVRIGIYGDYLWGFPFKTFRGGEFFRAEGLVINIFIIAGTGFILGFLFRFACSKLTAVESDLE
jgi:hypothetical protein